MAALPGAHRPKGALPHVLEMELKDLRLVFEEKGK